MIKYNTKHRASTYETYNSYADKEKEKNLGLT